MANIFLNDGYDEIETAIMLEKAYIQDIGASVAYTDGARVFVNTDDNLDKILPAYSKDMLKWILWHERYHNELKHHKRYYDYLHENKTTITAKEVNIIMDILVHDILSKMFPELIETAEINLAQFRNRNQLGYTFKTYTLEEMLDEYKRHKTGEDNNEDEEDEEDEENEDEKKDSKGKDNRKQDASEKEHIGDIKPQQPSEENDASGSKEQKEIELPDRHNETDWSALNERGDEEFISVNHADEILKAVERLKLRKIKLGRLTKTLNGLATTTRERTYRLPSNIHVGNGVILKGKTPGRAALYLCFDASGSMGQELSIFKEIISQSIPQAMTLPCEWFSGYDYNGKDLSSLENRDKGRDYYKGKFKDIMTIRASNGYGDDGDRTIKLCWEAEQKGYSPIGVTDGGGGIYWAEDELKQLKRTTFVGQDAEWFKKVKKINPTIQTIDISMEEMKE